MEKEISAGAIIFRRKGKKIEYLLLKHETSCHKGEYWNFPKGHIEKGESETEAAKREIFEETGIKVLKFIPGFPRHIFSAEKAQRKGFLKPLFGILPGHRRMPGQKFLQNTKVLAGFILQMPIKN